mgnify:CR=1 FL=1
MIIHSIVHKKYQTSWKDPGIFLRWVYVLFVLVIGGFKCAINQFI